MFSRKLFSIAILIQAGIFNFITAQAQQKPANQFTINGYVKERESFETIIGASVYSIDKNVGVSTNTYGFYSISIPATGDSATFICRMVGYEPAQIRVKLDPGSFEKDFILNNVKTETVVVEGGRATERESERTQMSSIYLPVEQVKNLPAFLGEKDVFKALQLMPGVQKGSEGQSGIYVRGGGPDQNLVLLDDAPVYNAFHLFGFFSVFNGDAIKSIELVKGGFPGRYGGRLSSVIDITMKDGNKEEIKSEIGMGIISGRGTVEGPLIKGKSSFLVSARRTWIDALIRLFTPSNTTAGYYFYDFNAKVNYEISRKDKLYLSGYFGRDLFYARFTDGLDRFEAGLGWGNGTGTLRWNHLYNSKLFSNLSVIYSRFQFKIYAKEDFSGVDYEFNYFSNINDIGLKYDFDYLPNTNHRLKFGVQPTLHVFKPNAFILRDGWAGVNNEQVPVYYGLENGLYIEDEYTVNNKLKLLPGLRVSTFLIRGQTYAFPEPRFSSMYKLNENTSLKASYAEMNQFLHLLSNTGTGLPTDYWVPSTARVKPQRSRQVAIGAARDLPKGMLFTVEAYYKKMDRIINYKDGASFLGIEDNNQIKVISFEDNVTAGQGWSYGLELFLQKKFGKLNGWLGYTLSKTEQQFNDINNGKKFYARYDRRHDFSAVAIYEHSDELSFSATWVYGTGQAITVPLAIYDGTVDKAPALFLASGLGAYRVSEFTERNAYRMAPYHRLDLAIKWEGKSKWADRKIHEVSLYNAYNRRNPYFYTTRERNRPNGRISNELISVALFPIIPSYTFTYIF